MGRKNVTLAVFIDFQKAFDTIYHTALIHTLNKFGINGTTQCWISLSK